MVIPCLTSGSSNFQNRIRANVLLPLKPQATMASLTTAKIDLLKCKIVNDPIHGQIELHPLAVKIIDTPQFQRLRFIHQLGAAYYVFPGATHKRFDHSIGVYHLAFELVKTLRTQQPGLNITDADILCVVIAGLCHDLGHGPFSHLFDKKFMKLVHKKWKHESGSQDMLDHLIEENKSVKDAFVEYKLQEQDRAFIKALIHSPNEEDRDEKKTGRDPDKSFLYEIVANKRNGIDVDKWDYFARDAYYVGLTNSFDHRRLMKFARVLQVEGKPQICWRDKEGPNLYDMFYTRSELNRRVYQHRTTWAVETMIADALVEANDCGSEIGLNCKMSEAVNDMSAFEKLTDCVFNQILNSTDDKLANARNILKRIERRDLYRLIGVIEDDELKKLNILKDEIKYIKNQLVGVHDDESGLPAPGCDQIAVQTFILDYGLDEDNPIEEVWFYRKRNPDVPTKLESHEVPMKPAKFSEKSFRIFSKEAKYVESLTKCYETWCAQNAWKGLKKKMEKEGDTDKPPVVKKRR